MSSPSAWAKKRPSVAMPIAIIQGAASASISGTPQAGRSARNQGAVLSIKASVMPVSNGTIGPTGPFNRIDTPRTPQKAAACLAVNTPGRRYARPNSPMAAATVASSAASVLAMCVSTSSTMQAASIAAPSSAARRPTSARPKEKVASTARMAPSIEGTRYAKISLRAGIPTASSA